MPSSITGTPLLSASPTGYPGTNSQLSPAIQVIWSKEILFQSMPVLRYEQFAVKKTELMTRAASEIAMSKLLLDLTTVELQRTQGHILLLLKTAQERVVGFLLEMARREDSDVEIELRMSRQDIADYLGLTIETVSRTLTRLECDSTIALPSSRHIVLCDRPALDRLNA